MIVAIRWLPLRHIKPQLLLAQVLPLIDHRVRSLLLERVVQLLSDVLQIRNMLWSAFSPCFHVEFGRVSVYFRSCRIRKRVDTWVYALPASLSICHLTFGFRDGPLPRNWLGLPSVRRAIALVVDVPLACDSPIALQGILLIVLLDHLQPWCGCWRVDSFTSIFMVFLIVILKAIWRFQGLLIHRLSHQILEASGPGWRDLTASLRQRLIVEQ